MKEVVHDYGDAAGFLREYQACFATRADGSSWPNWETTWQRGTQYFRGLIRPGNNKSIAGIASMVDIKQERQCYHIITTRCQEHGKTNIYRKLGDEEERFTCALPVQINAITDIDALSYLLIRTLIPSRHRASHKMLVHTRIIGHTTAAAVAAIDERIIKNTTNAFI